MRYLYIMLFMLFSGIQVYSQNWEAGAFVGGANYIGDVGNTTYIKPSDLVFGGLLKWNRSTRHSYRLSLLYSEIEGIDRESNDIRRQQRGYSFTNSILEVSAGIEFTYFDYDPHRSEPQSTPYLYTGINFFRSDHLSLNQLPYQTIPPGGSLPSPDPMMKRGTNWAFAIPMVLGYKQTISSFLSAGIEIGARYSFTDNFDGSAPSEMDDAITIGNRPGTWDELEFGNPNTSDWYVFTGIYLTINWGQKPCYTHL